MATNNFNQVDANPHDSTSELASVFSIQPYKCNMPLDTKPLLQLLAGAYQDGIRYLALGKIVVQPLYRDIITKAARGWLANQDGTRRDATYNCFIPGTSTDVRFMLGIKGYENDLKRGNAALTTAENSFARDFLRRDINSYLQIIGAKNEVVLVLQQSMSERPLEVIWTARHYPKSLARLLQTFSLQLDKTTANGSKRIFSGEIQPYVANQPQPQWNGKTRTFETGASDE